MISSRIEYFFYSFLVLALFTATESQNTTVSSDDDATRWDNASLWRLGSLVTLKPFTLTSITTASTTSASTNMISETTISQLQSTQTTTIFSTSTTTEHPSIQTTTITFTTSISSSSAFSTPIQPFSSCNISDSDACENGGTCVQNTTDVGRSYCNCTIGFYGDFCQYNISKETASRSSKRVPIRVQTSTAEPNCPSDYCQNGGTCRWTTANISNPTFACSCVLGFVGKRCSFLDVCYWNKPCENGGSCSTVLPVNGTAVEDGKSAMAVNSSFRCQCQRGFNGNRCQVSANESNLTIGPSVDGSCNVEDASNCKNGAICTIRNGSSVCICTANFTGTFCDDPVKNASTTSDTSSTWNTGVIVGAVVGAIAFIGLIIGCVFLFRYIQRSRKLKGKYNPAREEMAARGQTLTLATVTTGERLV